MCMICDRIEMIKNGTNPYFVKELDTGYVVLGDHQHFKGYTLFLCKTHETELFHLDRNAKCRFLEEMSLVAEAVSRAFGAVVGVAMFGDNLSFISDTTIAACNGQGCNMKDKFRKNILIALPAALVTIGIILAVSMS